MPNEHAPLIVRDNSLQSWGENSINLAGVPVQYGYGCLDGMINTLKVVGDNAYLVAVDAGAHFARHIYNSARAVLYKTPKEAGTLEEAVRAGRDYDFDYSLSLETRKGIIDLQAYYSLYINMMQENMALGFVHGNYVRPFYAACEERLDETKGDFQINGRVYKKTFSIMMQHWPSTLVPKHPDFPGLNVLLCRNSRCPAPETSLIDFKSSSTYAPTRGPAVEEKNVFNDLYGKKMPVHEILLLDYKMSFVREASGSNLFLVSPDGVFLTPGLDRSIFPGLTRDFVKNIVQGEVGQMLGYRISECDFGLDLLRNYAENGGELFFTGSALGAISAKRLLVPKTNNPQSLDDYEIIEFKSNAITSIIQDCYRCFSVGDGFEVSSGVKTTRVTDLQSAPLLFEIAPEHREKAEEKFMCIDGVSKLSKPPDQIMRSGHVTPIPSKESRIIPHTYVLRL